MEQKEKERELTSEEFIKLVEPKQQQRFLVKFPKPFDINQFVIHEASRPKYNFLEDTWGDITFRMMDPICPSTSQAVMDGLKILKEDDEFKDECIIITIEMLDPLGMSIEQWNVKGKIKTVDFGKLTYKESDMATIEIVFLVEDAILNY